MSAILRTAVLALLCLFLLGADANPPARDESAFGATVNANDLDLLEGDWQVFAFDPGDEKALGRVFTFRGAELSWRNPDAPKVHVTFQVKLGRAGELATVDLSRELDGRIITALGVYRLDGDALEMHYSWDDARPAALERPSGGFTFRLKRMR